ncbi:hypothetical protein [Pseudonocardia sp.]|uniref:hypothetical protein n=1 Tax=Pseudonocardia sp. TaxID=60912 RepID=UPI0026226342|nr:hypothetical protein [Pseudonocardia sp.]
MNALGNCKRAIHLAIDEALSAYGLLAGNARLNFPQRLELLDYASLLPISVFRRLNVERNLMEHEYAVPDELSAKEAIDITTLLLLAVSTLCRRVIYECVATIDDSSHPHQVIRLMPSTGQLRFHWVEVPDGMLKELNGVTCVRYPLRTLDGLVPGVEIRTEPVRVIELKTQNRTEWAPIIRQFSETARSHPTETPARMAGGYLETMVRVPLADYEAEAIAEIFSRFGGGYKSLFVPEDSDNIVTHAIGEADNS